METGEVITVQIGPAANSACLLWWNSIVDKCAAISRQSDEETEGSSSQGEEFSVLFRNIGSRGSSFNLGTLSPRSVMIDLKENIGSRPMLDLSSSGKSGDVPQLNWSGASSVHQAEPDAAGSGWLKDANFPVDPKCLVQIGGFAEEFADSYEHGRGLWTSGGGKISSEIEDSLRFLAEECDALEGFNVICDGGSGLIGLSEPLVSQLRDDFGSRKFLASFLLYNRDHHLSSTSSPWSTAGQRLNTGLALASLAESSAAILPFQPRPSSLQVPLCHFAFLETLTSPYWFRSSFGGLRFGETLDHLRQRPGCPVLGTSLNFPGDVATVSALETLLSETFEQNSVPDVFGVSPKEGGGGGGGGVSGIIAAVAVTLGLGAPPVQDPHTWLRSAIGAKLDCRMDMVGKSLDFPSFPTSGPLAADSREMVKLWSAKGGKKPGVASLATCFQGDSVGSFLASAADFCVKASRNAKFLAAVSSDPPRTSDEASEASELLSSFSDLYQHP